MIHKVTGFGNPQKKRKAKRDTAKSQIEEKIKLSIDLYQQGDYIQAKTLLHGVIEADKRNSLALGFLATIEKALGNTKTALSLFERSISIDQNNPDFLHNYSGLLAESDLTKAINLSEKAINICPNKTNFLARNGWLKLKASDFDNALKSIAKALELEPGHIDATISLSNIYKGLGNLKQARSATLECLKHRPDNPSALLNLFFFFEEEDFQKLKSIALRAVNQNQMILNNLDFIEAISSLGENFAQEVISTKNHSINEFSISSTS